MTDTITVKVRVFSLLKEIVGSTRFELELPAGAAVSDLVDRLTADYPDLRRHLAHIIVAVNHTYADRSRPLASGDEVALFPPVSGGSEDTHVSITAGPIDPLALLELTTEPGAGAVVTFSGVVRDQSGGRPVEYLEYDAYREMAEAKLRQVIAEARQRWPKVRRVAAVHRTGRLELGETIVMIAASAPHREDGAFEAARYVIDRLKEIVPIWKKEGWADGEEWLQGDYQPRPGE